jgi:hypothetical protein
MNEAAGIIIRHLIQFKTAASLIRFRKYMNYLSFLDVFIRAQRTHLHFCLQHWLLCHLGLY